MRFGALHLRAYGPFTGTVLNFEKDGGGLQIVFGQNEAGKSSALRAVSDFLFGIPGQTSDNFVHDYPDLRVGAVVGGEDGRRHALMRRKGNKSVLFAFDEQTGEEKTQAPIPTERLAELMPGVDPDLFRMLFGLSHEALRHGGQLLLQGEGNVGTMLFEAGAGLRDVKGTLDTLDAEARRLFVARGSSQAINTALRDYQTNRTIVRDTLVKPQVWKDLDGKLEEAKTEVSRLQTDQRAQHRELAKKRRLRDLRHTAMSRQSLLQVLDELKDVAKLPEDARAVVTSARERVEVAAEQIAEAEARIKGNEAALASIVVSAPHLEAATDIEALHHAADGARDAREELRTLTVALKQEEGELVELLRELSPGTDPAAAATLLPSSAVSARVRALVRQLNNVTASRAAAQVNGDKALEKERIAEESLAVITAPGDISALEATVEALHGQGDLEKALSGWSAKVKEIGDDVKRLCAGLEHPDEVKLFALARPQKSTVDDLKKRLQQLEETNIRLGAEEKKLQADMAQRQTDIRLLNAAGAVVTGSSLEALRRHRDELWSGIRCAYVEKTRSVGEVKAELAIERELPDEFERELKAADDQADLLKADTARATKYAELEKRVEDMTRDLERIATEKAKLASDRERWNSDWAGVLTPLELALRSPDALFEWLRDFDHAVARVSERDHAQGEQTAIEAAIEKGFAALEAAYVQASLPFPKLPSLSALLAHAKAQLKLAQEHLREIAVLEKDKRDAGHAINAAEAEVTKQQGRWNALMEAAASDLTIIGLSPAASPEEIEARLERLAGLAASHQAVQQTKARADASQAAWDEFVRAMKSLAKRIGVKQPEEAEEYLSLAGTFYGELDAARTARARYQGLQSAIAADRQKVLAETAKKGTAEERLNALVVLAGCEKETRLDEAISVSERRRKAEADLAEVEAGLRGYSCEEVSSLLEAAAAVELDTLQSEISELEAALEALEPHIKVAQEQAAQVKAELDRIDGSVGAVTARENMEHFAAAMHRDAAEYARTRLAEVLLGRAIQTYQQRSQGPLVKRASEWFSQLTAGRYVRLATDYEADQQVMFAERADGKRLAMVQLSEGTADQLYLALRLAAIEGRLETSHAMPLILDDALLAFDDGHALTALRALATLGRRNQVILFTHHSHIMGLALKNLKHGEFATHELSAETLLA